MEAAGEPDLYASGPASVVLVHQRRHVGKGWQPLVDRLHADLTELLGDYQLNQVKQKDGGLRYYISVPDGTAPRARDEADRLRDEAEDRSLETCEECGAPGGPAWINSWTWTLCDAHAEELRRR